MKKLIILFLSFFIFSCQPIEKLDSVVFDNNQFSKFDILTATVEINEIFEKKLSNPYIGHTLKVDPSQRIINWVKDNFNAIGNEDIFTVTILDASLTQNEIKNSEAKNFDEKTNYKFELFYLIEFNLYDDSRNLVASTVLENSRSTTSGLYVSINEKETIVYDLVYQSLNDLSNEAKLLLPKYMGEFIL